MWNDIPIFEQQRSNVIGKDFKLNKHINNFSSRAVQPLSFTHLSPGLRIEAGKGCRMLCTLPELLGKSQRSNIMGIMILGPLNQNSSVATDELHRLFADPRRAFKQQSALLNFDEFLAVAITRARALGANIDNIPGDARPVEQINRWIVYPDGVVTPVIGCTYTDDSVWVFNPDNPLRVTKLDRNDCGIRWWVSFGGNHRQALANQASAKARDLCRTVKNGRNPNNALRAARA